MADTVPVTKTKVVENHVSGTNKYIVIKNKDREGTDEREQTTINSNTGSQE